jgi:hypothetical protein
MVVTTMGRCCGVLTEGASAGGMTTMLGRCGVVRTPAGGRTASAGGGRGIAVLAGGGDIVVTAG